MKVRDIVIIGAGGAGRETLGIIRDIERNRPDSWNFRGFLADAKPDDEILARIDASYLGSPVGFTERLPEAAGWFFVSGMGSPQHRRSTEILMLEQGLELATLIHPTAQVGDDTQIGQGSVVCANCVITTNVRMGRSVQVNIGCVIAHDARIGDYVTFAQSVNVSGNVTIADGATIFTNAILLPGVTVGKRSTVGAGAVVVSEVPGDTTVTGVPARPIVKAG